ncbi:Phenylalanine--tRNA ligase beta subunit [Wickerhamiella sorbophila]|uniref:phenylalanine--tRNA ligase n=1 Tax=Wickerhamiella sorbophila TaxID=45607 RepID=A0A2T0FIP3_9ASCO|nr:Phenylalanine--tRNA ligase beta subunit [Wickerhamiella sorbophila]PRT54874.1 Phenylalanine--tRNA ligase beta subunit [Wickerhamiella sorbophila]
MPTVSIDREDLYQALGRPYTEKELDELCFEYGLELDEWDEDSARPTVKIEVPANRYDMLSMEGISRALAIYLEKQQAPKFKVVVPENPVTLTIEPEVASIRPYASGAILRGVTFTQRRYESFIALQDKLHANLCRNRSLVAIGTHDMAKMSGNVRYQGRRPQDIKFAPLNQTKEMTGPEIIEFYKADRNLSKYVPLIEDSEYYPLFVDENDTVLSLPPLINSNATKITLDTKDIFFDLTATDETKLAIVVDELVSIFSEYAAEPFTIEAVKIIYADGSSKLSPDMNPRKMVAEVSYLNSVLALDKTPKELCQLLERMGLGAESDKTNSDLLQLEIPVSRPDILHQCDIVEEVGIAYGFNNLTRSFPGTANSFGKPLVINKVSDILRRESFGAGWAEVMPLTLSSIEENFDWMRKPDDGTAVHLANPKTLEYQVVRTTLYPGLLKTIKENRMQPLPIKVFESGEVAFKDTTRERQARNERHFAAVYAGKTSGFEIAHGLLDRLMQQLRYEPNGADRGYWLEETNDPSYFPGRAANIVIKRDGKTQVVGTLGVFHPEVLQKFEIPFVCSGLELDVRKVM